MLNTMKIGKQRWLPVAVFVMLQILAGNLEANTQSYDEITSETSLVYEGLADTGYYDSMSADLSAQHGLSMLTAMRNGGAVWSNGQGKSFALEPEGTKYGGNPTSVWSGDYAYNLWWRKLDNGDKALYFAHYDAINQRVSARSTVNSSNGILRYSFAHDGQGALVAVYFDERDSRYQIWSNSSQDHGLTWGQQDVRLDRPSYTDGYQVRGTMEPQVASYQGRFIAVWKEGGFYKNGEETIGQDRLVASVSTDRGLSWSEARPIATNFGVYSEQIISLHDGVYYVGTNAKGGIAAFWSQDGVEWTPLGELENSANMQASQLTLKGDADHLYVSFSMRNEKTPKVRIQFGRLNLKTKQWDGPAQRIDANPLDLSNEFSADMAVLSPGVLGVVWEDYRTIKPTVMLNLSFDSGSHWLPKPISMEPRSGAAYAVYPKMAAAKEGGGQAMLLYMQKDQQTGNNLRIMKQPIVVNPETQEIIAPKIKFQVDQQEAKTARLRERATEFWDMKQQDKSYDTWRFYDPALRQQTTERKFGANMMDVKYKAYDIKKIEVYENHGYVIMTLNAEAPNPEQSKANEPIVVNDTLINHWLWVDHDWFLEYKPAFGEPLIRY